MGVGACMWMRYHGGINMLAAESRQEILKLLIDLGPLAGNLPKRQVRICSPYYRATHRLITGTLERPGRIQAASG